MHAFNSWADNNCSPPMVTDALGYIFMKESTNGKLGTVLRIIQNRPQITQEESKTCPCDSTLYYFS